VVPGISFANQEFRQTDLNREEALCT
jgi:hypothetical protein